MILASPDPKPAPRVKNSDLLKILRLKAAFRECAVCGSTWDIHLHHVLYRSNSGDDTEANIAPVCNFHHRQIHARDPVTWESLALYVAEERPDTLAYLKRKLGPAADTFFANLP